jgi:hypothetical protein
MDDEYQIGDYAEIHTMGQNCLIGIVTELHDEAFSGEDVITFTIIDNTPYKEWLVPYNKSKLNYYATSFIRKLSNEEVLQYIMEQ